MTGGILSVAGMEVVTSGWLNGCVGTGGESLCKASSMDLALANRSRGCDRAALSNTSVKMGLIPCLSQLISPVRESVPNCCGILPVSK